MTLGQKQRLFAKKVALLILYANEIGYELSFAEAYRPSGATWGHPNSLHSKRLAVDLNLFKDGVYLTKTEDYTPLGEFWEGLHPDCTWGGRFSDGNHFSFRHEGMR